MFTDYNLRRHRRRRRCCSYSCSSCCCSGCSSGCSCGHRLALKHRVARTISSSPSALFQGFVWKCRPLELIDIDRLFVPFADAGKHVWWCSTAYLISSIRVLFYLNEQHGDWRPPTAVHSFSSTTFRLSLKKNETANCCLLGVLVASNLGQQHGRPLKINIGKTVKKESIC